MAEKITFFPVHSYALNYQVVWHEQDSFPPLRQQLIWFNDARSRWAFQTSPSLCKILGQASVSTSALGFEQKGNGIRAAAAEEVASRLARHCSDLLCEVGYFRKLP